MYNKQNYIMDINNNYYDINVQNKIYIVIKHLLVIIVEY